MGPAYELLTKIRTFSNDDREIADAATRALEQDMPPAYRYCLLFALAKMHADCGNYDAAFERYRQANELQAGSDDGSAISKAFARMREIFDRELLSRLPARGHRSRKPVFIVGMPRSGTTLMERIIAAHPEAAAAGELQHIARLAVDEFPADGEPVEPSDPRLTQKRLRELAADYLAVLEQGRSNASRIVDKMPNNVFYLGFVRALFPEATIIHARRHPLDVCISCYFQHFVHLGWSNDFSSIARLYSLYRGAIAHWKQVLPDGDIVEVRYEELVQDPAGEARRLVEACGLDWDDSILERATIGGAVRTASMGQVRQPVYTSSQQTWIRYAAHVEPLAQALAPYLEDDRDLLAEHGIRIGRRRGLLRRLLG